MGDLTQRANDAILCSGTEQVLTPEESLRYLKEPTNFQSFAAYTERLAEEKKIDLNGEPLPDYLAKRVIALDPNTSDAEKRRIRRFFRDVAWQKDANGAYPAVLNIRRDIAVKTCFCLGLNEVETNDFLRKACSMYGLNVRNAREAVYLYCIVSRQPYAKALELIRIYDEAPCIEAKEAGKGTRTLKTELRAVSMDTESDFVKGFLIPNKSEFTTYSKTLIRTYHELRTSLCLMLLEDILSTQMLDYKELTDFLKDVHMVSEDDPEDTAKQGFIGAVEYLKSKLEAVARVDEDFLSAVNEFKNGTDRFFAFEDIRDLLNEKYDVVPGEILQAVDDDDIFPETIETGSDLLDYLLNKAFSDDYLFSAILWGIPYLWGRDENTGRIQDEYMKYSLSSLHSVNVSVLSNFPRASYFRKIDRDELSDAENNAEQKRKVIILFCFAEYFFQWLVSDDGEEPDEAKLLARYNNFYTRLNDMLAACNLVCVYQADPFDWLILKSAASFLKLQDEDTSPIEFLNQVIRLSFDMEDDIRL